MGRPGQATLLSPCCPALLSLASGPLCIYEASVRLSPCSWYLLFPTRPRVPGAGEQVTHLF